MSAQPDANPALAGAYDTNPTTNAGSRAAAGSAAYAAWRALNPILRGAVDWEDFEMGFESGKVEMEARKDAAYLERNRCVALIARMAMAAGFRACVAKTVIEGWSEDWHGCVYVELPTGQASWHFHDSQAYLFAGIPEGNAVWDGHTTEEKYRRVDAAFQPPNAAALPPGGKRAQ